MEKKENKTRFLNSNTLVVGGILLLMAVAVLLLWYGNSHSNQAMNAITAQVYFDGEYRVADGEWHKIVKGEHIPATAGDVTLRGNFHMLAPDGEYVGICDGDATLALYTDHIHLTILEGGCEPYSMDMENPLFKDSSCGVGWTAYPLMGGEGPLEIRVHNPHRYGNETAIDELLSNTAFWTGMDFEKAILERGETQRNMGLISIVVSLLLLGTALFSTLMHTENSKIIWVLGIVILFASAYLIYSAEGVSLWRESIVSNTTILGCSMMFYMLFLSMALVYLLEDTKTIGTVAVAVLGLFNGVFILLPILTDVLFYDTWLYWMVAQALGNVILLGCLIKEFFAHKGKVRYLYACAVLPLISFGLDAAMIALGIWNTGVSSKYVFIGFFIVALVMVVKIIPNNINALAKAKELETERKVLKAELAESRVSIMMSQIRPHFIYNTLGSIEQLCELDPQKAGELVHNFAKYLRGNFGELDNPKPIFLSQEMEHVRHYLYIESVRFPDMSFSFEMNTDDFCLPALTIQPLVENAIKHGLMKLPKGGSIRIVSYETPTDYCVTVEDDGVGFDTTVPLDEKKHIGIRNIRDRLKIMVDGRLDIESAPGVGTKVTVTIPKEGKK